MPNKRKVNKNRNATGYTPPTKRKNNSVYTPSSSSTPTCPQIDFYFIKCINCEGIFTYDLTTDVNTNHCFTPIFDHSKIPDCKLDCSFQSPTMSCPCQTPPTINPSSMELFDESSNSTPVDSPRTISRTASKRFFRCNV